MAFDARWISYDPREARRRRRTWPWFLLVLLLLVAILAGGWLWYENSEAIDLARPVAIQAALPALLIDDAMVVYVVDDSGSMEDKLLPLYQALQEVADKPTENSEIALLMFGTTNRMLFDFTEPGDAPWDTAIPSSPPAAAKRRCFWPCKRLTRCFRTAPSVTRNSLHLFQRDHMPTEPGLSLCLMVLPGTFTSPKQLLLTWSTPASR